MISILFKLIYKFKAISSKIPEVFFLKKFANWTQNSYGNEKKSKVTKTILKTKDREFILSDFKTSIKLKYQDNWGLTQGWYQRKTESSNRPTHTWPTDFQQRCWGNSKAIDTFFQQILDKWIDICKAETNGISIFIPLSWTI